MSRGPEPKHSQQPPGVVENWSALQCSKKHTEQCGCDHAPVTRGRMRAQFPLPHGPPKENRVAAPHTRSSVRCHRYSKGSRGGLVCCVGNQAREAPGALPLKLRPPQPAYAPPTELNPSSCLTTPSTCLWVARRPSGNQNGGAC